MLRHQLTTAVEVPRQALALYVRHLVPIVAISSIPAAQRLVSVLTRPPDPLPVLLELLTVAARVGLVGLIVYWAFVRTPHEGEGQPGRFLRGHWPSLLIQLALLAAAVAVFDLLPEQVLVHWIPERSHDLYLGLLLAIKNPTVIAVTLIWTVLAARQILWYTGESAAARH
ncbi:hypothetical protein NDR87_35470 [Nocardia sp. CDC159]|uniref:Uncharacterized protein n=1 Tax=Nocardia pulmonis TaxID=2951408 RepID=A0A9X2EHJ6_9NOCA|nr:MULTISPECIES: hypothetical protein [Nocardia]MCM6778788.1 hypothetical protein [Nocardia pulmonis]MCM6791677.1 hypothetical protein [Nocardia sp. CDC159]